MTDSTPDNWTDGQSDDQKPNPLREQLRKLEKANKELTEQNNKLSGQIRRNMVETTLTGKGYSAKAASLIPVDIDPTEEAIGKWLEEYGDVLKPMETANSGGAEGDEDDSGASEEGQVMSRIAQATNVAQPAGAQKDVLNRLNSPDLTAAELMAMVHKAGGGPGSG